MKQDEINGLIYNVLANLANQAQNYNSGLEKQMEELREKILVDGEK